MEKVIIILSLTVLTSPLVMAAPPSEQRNGSYTIERVVINTSQINDSNVRSERRLREEKGLQRLKQHRWQAGYIMPQHYRGEAYKVEYREHNLPKPDRNQQWYRINNDYILINSDGNNIIQIVDF